jgi:hypothetical protein
MASAGPGESLPVAAGLWLGGRRGAAQAGRGPGPLKLEPAVLSVVT